VATSDSRGSWWSWRLLGLWVAINGAAYLVIVVGGVVLEELVSGTADLASSHRVLAVLVVAIIGSAFQGFVLGRWQWQILKRRMPGLGRRRWVIATFIPAFLVWLLVVAPTAVDIVAKGGDSLHAFRNGFVQALVLGPLIGLSQATALRDDTTRWKWWFVAAFPLTAFVFHGVWMLWVTAPEATSDVPQRAVHRGRLRSAHST
jgi:hypothetical protein